MERALLLLNRRSLLVDTLQVHQKSIDFAFAARTTVGVAVPLVVAVVSGHASYAVYLSIGSLVGGMASKRGVYRTRIATMLGIATFLGFATAIGTASSGQLVAELVLFALFGYVAGLVSSLGAVADYLGTHVLVALAIFSIQPLPPSEAIIAGLLAFSGALFQTLLCALSFGFEGVAREGKALADVYAKLGDYAEGLTTQQTAPPGVAELQNAHAVLADMHAFVAGETVATLQSLAQVAERLRVDLGTLATLWSQSETQDAAAIAQRQAISGAAAAILRAIADDLRGRTARSVSPDMWRHFDAADKVLPLPSLSVDLGIAWRTCRRACIPGSEPISLGNALEPIRTAPALILGSVL